MEKYKINVPFMGFTAGQNATREEILKALKLPIAVSDSEVLFALTMSGILSYILPERFQKHVFIKPTIASAPIPFNNTYSLIDQSMMMYTADTEGIPDATLQELLDLGYAPMYPTTKEGRLYMEFEGGLRLYAGDKVIKLIQVSEFMFEAGELELTDDFIISPKKGGEFGDPVYFPNEASLLKFFAEKFMCNCGNCEMTSGGFKLPVEEKLFSVNDIHNILLTTDANNNSPFARQFVSSVLESAMAHLV